MRYVRKFPGVPANEAISRGIRERKAAGLNVGSPCTPVDVEAVRALRRDGATWDQVVERLGCSKGVARRAGRLP